MKKTIISLLFLFIFSYSKSQTNHNIRGNAVDSDNNSIEYFHAVLLSPVDSSIIQGGAFIDGVFEFHKIKSNSYILQLSSVGYQTYYSNIKKTTQQTENLGIIKLASLRLKEVNVTAIRPFFRMEKDKFVMQIENSSLSDIGTSIDVLRQTPMVIIDSDNNLSVAGKDNTLVFIDGRKIYSNQELEMINSATIKKIEVITNPSAKYEASGKSVINIVTQKTQLLNGVSSRIKSDVIAGRKTWATEDLTLGYKNNKINILANYTYKFGKQKSYENFIREVILTLNDKTTTDYSTTFTSDYNTHEYRGGFNYKINNKHRLGVQINGWYNNNKYSTYTENNYSINSANGKTTTKSLNKPNAYLSTFNFNYDFIPDTLGQKLAVLLDFTRYSSDSDEKIYETDGTQLDSNIINNQSDYDIYSAKIDYQLPLSSINTELEVGSKYSKVTDGSKSVFSTLVNGSWQLQDIYTNKHNFDEELTAFYITLDKKIQKLSLNAGVRWEHIKSDGDNGKISIIDTSYSKFFPSASVNYKFNKKLSLTINYSKKIRRPSYSSLNPTIIYVDKYFYRQGNPNLRPEISNIYEISSTINDNLTVNFGYQYHKNPINFAFYQDKDNPSITMLTTENYKKKESLYLNASYRLMSKSGKFSLQNTLGYKKPKMKIRDHDESRTLSKPYYYFQQTCNVLVVKNTTLYSNFLFYHLGENDIFSYKSMSNFSIGIRTKFYKNKLLINAYANDIFDSMTWKKYTSINTMTMDHTYDPDNTYFKLSLTYNFGTFKPKLKSYSGNREEQNRL